MARNEFKKPTMRAAWKRSGERCEGDGELYGLDPNQRCNADLNRTGVRYDHIDPDANSKDNSLENCCACCPRCHDFKTRKFDVPRIAETVRQQDKHRGIRITRSRPMPGGRGSRLKRKFNGQVVPRHA